MTERRSRGELRRARALESEGPTTCWVLASFASRLSSAFAPAPVLEGRRKTEAYCPRLEGLAPESDK